jgi:uncharacterized protein YndB with AHSA1/START domain
MERLVGDVLALLDAAGVEHAHVVGHDWGGGVAWTLAEQHPERVASLVVLSTPHPGAMVWAVRHADQGRRSWYMLAMQLPVLPERGLARMLRRGGLARSGVPAGDARRYAARLGRARDLRGPVNWYRAILRPSVRRRQGRSTGVTVPTTYVWGSRDPFLGRAAAERTAHHVGGEYRFVEVPAGHWLPERQAELVAAEVLARVGRGRGRTIEVAQDVDRPVAEVYAFASEPSHLPLWATGLSGSIARVDGEWVARSPLGDVVVRFVPHNADGVLDHTVVLPDGTSVLNRVRVHPVGEGCRVVFTLEQRAGMSQQDLEDDAAVVRADLARLKRVVEERAGPGEGAGPVRRARTRRTPRRGGRRPRP